jgi:hypothetical protein
LHSSTVGKIRLLSCFLPAYERIPFCPIVCEVPPALRFGDKRKKREREREKEGNF